MKNPFSLMAVCGLALAAAPAIAQDANLCGGLGANGQWLGGDMAGSDVATAPSHLEQMALVLMRNEYIGLFELSAPTDVRVEAQGRGSGDPVIDVYDAGGNIVASDDDSGGGGASRVETFLPAGTYCVAMRSFDGSPMTGFVRAGRTEQDALTDGMDTTTMNTGFPSECDLGAAVPLALGATATGSADGQPFYSLTLNAPTSISLLAENQDADPVLALYDGNGNWLAENDDFDGLNSRIDMEAPLDPGTYCLAVTALSDSSLPIDVTAKEYDAAEVMNALFARGEAAPPLDGSYPVTQLGELTTRLRQDVNVGGDAEWYAIDIYEGGLLLVEAIAQGQGDPVLVIYDDLGREVGYNDDANGSLDSQLVVRIQPGTYLVAVRQLDNTMQGFIRLLFERYVPARP